MMKIDKFINNLFSISNKHEAMGLTAIPTAITA